MKVRIQGNSIRFRLRQPEVAAFGEVGKVEEIIEFGPDPADRLRFCLNISSGADLTVGYDANAVTVGVPAQLAARWASTELVGFDGKVDTGKGKVLAVLVEKDFVCLDRPEEENLGAYPNPNAVC